MIEFERRYLGDAVTVNFDGHHIVLDLRAQGDPHITISLNPDVYAALLKYQQDIIQHLRKVADAEGTETDAFGQGAKTGGVHSDTPGGEQEPTPQD